MNNSRCGKFLDADGDGYSATFGQAVAAANDPDLTNQYAQCVLFDFSYKYFYRDGCGKDYRILNVAEDHGDEARLKYLTACLLAFVQQLRLYPSFPVLNNIRNSCLKSLSVSNPFILTA